MNLSQGKVFEKAEAGEYFGLLIDLVDMPATIDPRTGQPALKIGPGGVLIPEKDKVRVTWTIAYTHNGQVVLETKPDEKTGQRQPLLVSAFYNATVAPKAKLGKAIAMIIGGQTPVIQTTEQLEQLLIGRANKLLITKEPNQQGNDFFNNIVGISPLPPGAVAPPIPQGFIRSKFRPKTQAGPQGVPVQTYATREAAAQVAGNTVSLNAGAPGSQAKNPDAF